ncbi:MAG: prolyl oligopeptidase family serine peptidase, partial [Pseudomonadota bacterium]
IPWLDGSTEVEAGIAMAAAVDKFSTFLDEVAEAEGIAPENTILLGFSQGTMMSLHVGPRRKAAFAGIIGFSGRLLQPSALAAEIKTKPPILLIHGDQDDVVPYSSMAEAETGLKAAGLSVETHTSPGTGHGIAPDGLSKALQIALTWL